MAFPLNLLFLTTIHPCESPKEKAKYLGDGVSAKTHMSGGWTSEVVVSEGGDMFFLFLWLQMQYLFQSL